MLEASFEGGIALDRILQKSEPASPKLLGEGARMSNWLHFRRAFPANGAKASWPVRFGTAVLSELSAFATIKHRAERSGR